MKKCPEANCIVCVQGSAKRPARRKDRRDAKKEIYLAR